MKYILIILAVLLFTSCKKESEVKSTPEEIEVMVYATPANDTTVLASTEIIQLQVR